MAFNIFTAERVSCFGQYDRIDDLITCKLRREKRSVHRQFLVDEFHFSAVCKCFDPLFVWHFGTSSVRGQCLSQVYVVRWEKLRSGMMSTLRNAPPNFLARLSDGMRRPVSTGCVTLPMIDVLLSTRKGDRR